MGRDLRATFFKEFFKTKRSQNVLDENDEQCLRTWEEVKRLSKRALATFYVFALLEGKKGNGHFFNWAYEYRRNEMSSFLKEGNFVILINAKSPNAAELISLCQKREISYEVVENGDDKDDGVGYTVLEKKAR